MEHVVLSHCPIFVRRVSQLVHDISIWQDEGWWSSELAVDVFILLDFSHVFFKFFQECTTGDDKHGFHRGLTDRDPK